MTDEQIQAEIDKRLAAESEPAADAAPVVGAPAATSDASDASDASAAYRALDEAEAQARAEKKPKGFAKEVYDAYEKLPEGVAKTLLAGAASVATGAALRKGLPEKAVYGTPAYREAQAGIEADRAAAPLAQRAAGRAYDTVGYAYRQMLSQQQEHAANTRALQDAMREHAYANTLNVDDEMARRAAPAGLPSSSGAGAPVGLTVQPRGGEGTAAYAQKFGATPAEAQRVSSMSEMQQKNIPAQLAAWNKISSVAPTFEAVKESPLLLGTEGQKAVQERLAAQQAAATAQVSQAEQQKVMEEQQRRQVQGELARHKAEAQMRLDAARDAFKASERAAQEATRAQAAQGPQHRAIDENEELQRRLQKVDPNAVMRALAKVGTTVAPRLVPMAGSAFAPIQAANAKKSYDQGRYVPALAQGLGSVGNILQATGVPPLMGAGTLMQLPAGAVELYDLMSSEPETGR